MLNHKILGGASAMLGALAFFSANPVKADAASNVHISRLDEGFITNEVNQDPGETGEIINGRDLTLDLNSGTTQNDSNSDKKQEGIIQVKLIDDDSNGRVLDTETYTGNVGDKIGAPATKDVVYYMNRGYFLMDKNYGPDTKFSNMVQNFEAHFAHGHQFFSPDHPAIVGNDLNRQMDLKTGRGMWSLWST